MSDIAYLYIHHGWIIPASFGLMLVLNHYNKKMHNFNSACRREIHPRETEPLTVGGFLFYSALASIQVINFIAVTFMAVAFGYLLFESAYHSIGPKKFETPVRDVARRLWRKVRPLPPREDPDIYP